MLPAYLLQVFPSPAAAELVLQPQAILAVAQQIAAGDKNDTGSKKSEKKNTRTLEISATATGDGTVLHGATGSSNSEKFSGEWSKTVELPKDEGYTVSVTGDIFNSDDSQQVSCKIIVDGKVEEEKTGSGSAGSAFCNVSPKYF
ncbi:MAG: MmpS family transport accessory protein [Rothia dentocariosa]